MYCIHELFFSPDGIAVVVITAVVGLVVVGAAVVPEMRKEE